MSGSRFISIKWKLSAAFIALGVGLVGGYVLIAKDTFESDKISYVFDSQQAQVEAAASDFNQKIEQALVLSKAIISTYDVQSKALSSIGQRLFNDQKSLLALELLEQSKKELIVKVENESELMPAMDSKESAITAGAMDVRVLSHKRILITTGQKGDSGETLILRILLEGSSFFPKTTGTVFMMIRGGQILAFSTPMTQTLIYQEIISEFSRARAEITSLKKVGNEEFLVSSLSTKFADIRFVAVTPKAEALGALNVLLKRSMVFVLFSLFVTILIALTVSKSLTSSLATLTQAAAKIGRGDFSSPVVVKSHDEVGILSTAFQKMGLEIKRLLEETKDKARMEAELKTASLVQESLLPKSPDFQKNEISLSGYYATSTECGGDWWYYFEHGNDLYVAIADATGHGTPSALITASARAVFSMIEKAEMTLPQMMSAWDYAISSCSAGKVFMTAQLFKINTLSGEIVFINACHEPPLNLKLTAVDELSGEYLEVQKGTTLGELLNKEWVEERMTLGPGQKLILLTDGLFSVVNADGKALSDRRYMQNLLKRIRWSTTTTEIIAESAAIIERHRNGILFPDDITLVAISRRPILPLRT